MSSPPDRENHARTVRFTHLGKPLPYWYVARDIQQVPNQWQTLGAWWMWELGLGGGISGPKVPCKSDEENGNTKEDSQMGEYRRTAQHDAGRGSNVGFLATCNYGLNTPERRYSIA